MQDLNLKPSRRATDTRGLAQAAAVFKFTKFSVFKLYNFKLITIGVSR